MILETRVGFYILALKIILFLSTMSLFLPKPYQLLVCTYLLQLKIRTCNLSETRTKFLSRFRQKTKQNSDLLEAAATQSSSSGQGLDTGNSDPLYTAKGISGSTSLPLMPCPALL